MADDADKPDGKPLTESKTVTGGVIGAASTAAAAVPGFLASIDNPYMLAGLAIVIIAAGVGLYLVIKGRIDVRDLAGV